MRVERQELERLLKRNRKIDRILSGPSEGFRHDWQQLLDEHDENAIEIGRLSELIAVEDGEEV